MTDRPTPEEVAEDIHNRFHPYAEQCGPECKNNLITIAAIIKRERETARGNEYDKGYKKGDIDGQDENA